MADAAPDSEELAPDDHEPRLCVSVEKAARTLDISVRAIYYLVAAGDLPMVKLGRATRFSVKDLENLVATKRVSYRVAAPPGTSGHDRIESSGPSL